MFIDERIEVYFHEPPTYEKSPHCPNAFEWNGTRYEVLRSDKEWVDFTRRGKFARNMSDAHLESASSKGSLGVGRFFFEVITTTGEYFVIYFDRAPTKRDNKGSWVLYKSIERKEEGNDL